MSSNIGSATTQGFFTVGQPQQTAVLNSTTGRHNYYILSDTVVLSCIPGADGAPAIIRAWMPPRTSGPILDTILTGLWRAYFPPSPDPERPRPVELDTIYADPFPGDPESEAYEAGIPTQAPLFTLLGSVATGLDPIEKGKERAWRLDVTEYVRDEQKPWSCLVMYKPGEKRWERTPAPFQNTIVMVLGHFVRYVAPKGLPLFYVVHIVFGLGKPTNTPPDAIDASTASTSNVSPRKRRAIGSTSASSPSVASSSTNPAAILPYATEAASVGNPSQQPVPGPSTYQNNVHAPAAAPATPQAAPKAPRKTRAGKKAAAVPPGQLQPPPLMESGALPPLPAASTSGGVVIRPERDAHLSQKQKGKRRAYVPDDDEDM